MDNKFEEFWEKVNQAEPNFNNKKLCSVKQFVGDGEILIDKDTTTFNSKLVNVNVKKNNGKIYTLSCDYAVSNGIKTGRINEVFLMYEELSFIEFEDDLKPYYDINCCVFYENKKYIIKFDIKNLWCGPYGYLPIEEPDDIRFSSRNFKILCTIKDYIGENGNFYQNKIDLREFVITREENDRSPVRLLCSQELEFQLYNGKNPKDLLEHFIGIYKNDNGEEFLRIFDYNNLITEPWYRDTGMLFIINQIMKNPFKYSFINVTFDEINYLKIK